jgi:DNA ligase-1
MNFSQLATYIFKLEKTASRNEMTEILAELLEKSEGGEEVERTVCLLLGILAPNYKGVVFNLAERMMLKVLAEAYGKSREEVLKSYKSKGDLGDTAEELAIASGKGGGGNKGLSVEEVHKSLLEVAGDEGEGSQERKIRKMAQLLSKLESRGAKYVARMPVGRLRLGFSDKTILDALSVMDRGDKSGKKKLEQAYNVLPDVGLLTKMVKEQGLDKATEKVVPVPGVPVLAMLAQRLKTADEMIKKMGTVAVEPKLDGLRIAIHYKAGKGGFTKAFTRNLNETSWMFPELSEIDGCLVGREVILDSEAVGVDKTRQTMANFQTTMTRRRKHEIARLAEKVRIQFYLFDILYLDGRSLIGEPYRVRRRILEEAVRPGNTVKIVEREFTSDPERIRELNAENRNRGLEGIIVKRAEGKYISGRTGWLWVKMKEAEEAVAKLSDTVDCLVMGYSTGKGKRVGFGVGQFLVGVKDGEEVKTISKIGTGLTDDQFRELKRRLDKIGTENKPKEYAVVKGLTPDFWVNPELVVEIAADEITKSPSHSSGYALRFPRLVRFRDDKSGGQATTVAEIMNLSKQQKQISEKQ